MTTQVANQDIIAVLRVASPAWLAAEQIAAKMKSPLHKVQRILRKNSDDEKSAKTHHLGALLSRGRDFQTCQYALR